MSNYTIYCDCCSALISNPDTKDVKGYIVDSGFLCEGCFRASLPLPVDEEEERT